MKITARPIHTTGVASLDDVPPNVLYIHITSEEKIALDVADYAFPNLITFESDKNIQLIGAMDMIAHSPELERFSAWFMSHTHWAAFPYLPKLKYVYENRSWLSGKCMDVSQLPALYQISVYGGRRANPLGLLIADTFRVDTYENYSMRDFEARGIICKSTTLWAWTLFIGESKGQYSAPKFAATIEEFEKLYGDPLELLHLEPPKSRAKSALSNLHTD